MKRASAEEGQCIALIWVLGGSLRTRCIATRECVLYESREYTFQNPSQSTFFARTTRTLLRALLSVIRYLCCALCFVKVNIALLKAVVP